MTMATMTMRKAAQARTRAPQARTKAEVSAKSAPIVAPKPSLWTRVKSAASKTAMTIARPFKAVARKAKPAAKYVARVPKALMQTTVIKTVRTKTGVATKVVAVAAKRTWTRALREYLRVLMGATLIFSVITGMMVAPVTTLLVVGGTAALSFALAALIERFEKHMPGKVVRAFDVIGDIVLGCAYATMAVLAGVMCATSWYFALFTVLVLVLSYQGYRHAYSYAIIFAAFVFGHWGTVLFFGTLLLLNLMASSVNVRATEVPAYSEIRRSANPPGIEIMDRFEQRAPETSEVRPVDAPNNPETWTRGNHLRAKGTEELWGTEHDVPLVTAEDDGPADEEENWVETWRNDVACAICEAEDRDPHRGEARMTSPSPYLTEEADPMLRQTQLCSRHFAAVCEEDAVKYTGTSLSKLSCEVRLNAQGIEASMEYTRSRDDVSNLYWLETAWWRDRRGNNHPREWSCLHQGNVVATVIHDYRRKVFRATTLGHVVASGVKTNLKAAQRAATDELNDEGSMLSRVVETLEDAAGLVAVREGG
jgi:hypothetical protein